MRIAVVVLAGLAFAAGLIIEPAALVQIARICLGGHCGVPTRWIEISAFVSMAAGIVAIVRKRLRPPPPKRQAAQPERRRAARPRPEGKPLP